MRRALLAVACCLLLPGCSSPDLGDQCEGSVAQVTVLAASSLTDAFTRIGKAFDERHCLVHIRLSFGPSDGLAAQIQGGAPADVFASASTTWMDAVARDPGISDRADFARNRLTIIVPKDDPAAIASVQDLAKPGVKLVLAAEGVPAGDYGRQILDNAGIADHALHNVVSNAIDVKGVVQAVASGEADAGIVYVTDASADVRGQVHVVDIPKDLNVIATYPIGVVAGARYPDLAKKFVAYVDGPGQGALQSAGFLPAA